jgi:hypothetical protein
MATNVGTDILVISTGRDAALSPAMAIAMTIQGPTLRRTRQKIEGFRRMMVLALSRVWHSSRPRAGRNGPHIIPQAKVRAKDGFPKGLPTQTETPLQGELDHCGDLRGRAVPQPQLEDVWTGSYDLEFACMVQVRDLRFCQARRLK